MRRGGGEEGEGEGVWTLTHGTELGLIVGWLHLHWMVHLRKVETIVIIIMYNVA